MTAPVPHDADVAHLFVYGTLRPGESRWHHLAPYVASEGAADSVSGRLYDTGQGYPAAVFGDGGRITGHAFALATSTRERALAHLDEVEGAVRGLYRRVVVRTDEGVEAYAYEYGGGLTLSRIESGDWLSR